MAEADVIVGVNLDQVWRRFSHYQVESTTSAKLLHFDDQRLWPFFFEMSLNPMGHCIAERHAKKIERAVHLLQNEIPWC
jgi:hypothetical protein